MCCSYPTDGDNSCLSLVWAASPEPEVFWAENIIPLLEFQVMLSTSEWQECVSFLKFSEMCKVSCWCVCGAVDESRVFFSILLKTKDCISLCLNIDMYSFNKKLVISSSKIKIKPNLDEKTTEVAIF